MIEDYDFEPETAVLLSLFKQGGDDLERGLPGEPMSRECSDLLCEMDNATKGLVIIDLLVLANTLDSVILDMKMKELES